jgi:hypothetical protein
VVAVRQCARQACSSRACGSSPNSGDGDWCPASVLTAAKPRCRPLSAQPERAGVAAHRHLQHAVVAATALVQQAAVSGGGQPQFEAGVVGLAVGADALVQPPAQQAVGGQRVTDFARRLRVARAPLAGLDPFGGGDAQAVGLHGGHGTAAGAGPGRGRAGGVRPGLAGQRRAGSSSGRQRQAIRAGERAGLASAGGVGRRRVLGAWAADRAPRRAARPGAGPHARLAAEAGPVGRAAGSETT